MASSLRTSPSRSSLAPSFPSQADPYSSVSSYSSGKPATRRSLTLFIPKNVSAFIRSQGSISRRHNSVCQLDPVPTHYTDSASCHTMELQRTTSTSRGDDRLSRKPQKNKFYNFLRRSRSRSRSKAPVESDPAPELPILDFMGQSDVPVVPPPEHIDESKPPTRLPSRPLSSTTTTTNATVLPPTPTQTRRQRNYPPVHDLRAPPVSPTHDNMQSRPSTPKPSATRQKLHELFGIPLPSSRKNSLSRPASPELFQDAPPLPRTFAGLNFISDTNDVQNSTSHPNHDLEQCSLQPGPQRPPDSITMKEKSRTSGSSKLDFFRSPRMFSSSGLQKSNSTKRFTSSPSRILSSEPTPTLDGSSALQPSVSAPTSISDIQNSNITGPPMAGNGHLKPKSGDIASTLSSSAKPIPKIIQTPPTPAKSVESPSSANHRRKSSDLKRQPGAPRPLAVVGEENLLKQSEKDRGRRIEREWGRWSQRLPSPKFFSGKDAKEKAQGKEKDKVLSQGRVVIAITNSLNPTTNRPGIADTRKKSPSRGEAGRNVVRNSSLIGNGRTKHGSFDFEKPAWSLGSGRASTITRSGYSRSGDSLQSGISNGTRSTKRIERSVSSSHRPLENDSVYNRTPASSSNHLTPAGSTTSHSTTAHTRSHSLTTPAPAEPGLSSSLGRAASRHMQMTTNNLPAGVAHGPFSFEPPVQPPVLSGNSSRFETIGRVDTLQEPYSHKVSRKGRSLDLGLGLAWAPAKVKEEALLPFGRTLSREGSVRTAYESRNKPVSGVDVTNAFREVLDEDSFAKFKKNVHRFDAHAIPFDGPSGIVSRVDRLLAKSPLLDEDGKRDLLDRFVRLILQNA